MPSVTALCLISECTRSEQGHTARNADAGACNRNANVCSTESVGRGCSWRATATGTGGAIEHGETTFTPQYYAMNCSWINHQMCLNKLYLRKQMAKKLSKKLRSRSTVSCFCLLRTSLRRVAGPVPTARVHF